MTLPCRPYPGSARHRRGERGLTLIELLVVLTLMAMMAVLVAPMAVRSLPAVELRTIAQDMRGGFRAARTDAIRRNRESWVVIDLDANTYRPSTGRQPESLPSGVRMEMIVARSELIEPGVGRIRFFPDGTATGGEVRLISEARTLDVKVDWFDGSVTIVEVDDE